MEPDGAQSNAQFDCNVNTLKSTNNQRLDHPPASWTQVATTIAPTATVSDSLPLNTSWKDNANNSHVRAYLVGFSLPFVVDLVVIVYNICVVTPKYIESLTTPSTSILNTVDNHKSSDALHPQLRCLTVSCSKHHGRTMQTLLAFEHIWWVCLLWFVVDLVVRVCNLCCVASWDKVTWCMQRCSTIVHCATMHLIFVQGIEQHNNHQSDAMLVLRCGLVY